MCRGKISSFVPMSCHLGPGVTSFGDGRVEQQSQLKYTESERSLAHHKTGSLRTDLASDMHLSGSGVMGTRDVVMALSL